MDYDLIWVSIAVVIKEIGFKNIVKLDRNVDNTNSMFIFWGKLLGLRPKVLKIGYRFKINLKSSIEERVIKIYPVPMYCLLHTFLFYDNKILINYVFSFTTNG